MTSKKIVCLAASIVPYALYSIVRNLGPDRLCDFGLCKTFFIKYVLNLPQPLLALAVVSIIVFFFRDEIFYSWFKFAAWWVPLTIFLIIVFAPSGGSIGAVSYSMQETVSSLFPIIFIVASFGIVIWKWSLIRKKSGGKER
jgi:hypothetical protein